MDDGLKLIEQYEADSQEPDAITLDAIVAHYVSRNQPPTGTPIWRLVQDIQQQAYVYANIIEQIKSGRDPVEVRHLFEDLDLVSPRTIPNPLGERIVRWCFEKISDLRRLLVDTIKTRSRDIIIELSLEIAPSASINLGVNAGVPPSLSIEIEFSAELRAELAAG